MRTGKVSAAQHLLDICCSLQVSGLWRAVEELHWKANAGCLDLLLAACCCCALRPSQPGACLPKSACWLCLMVLTKADLHPQSSNPTVSTAVISISDSHRLLPSGSHPWFCLLRSERSLEHSGPSLELSQLLGKGGKFVTSLLRQSKAVSCPHSLVDEKKPCGNLISYSLKPEWEQMLLMFIGGTWGTPLLWVATKALLKLMPCIWALKENGIFSYCQKIDPTVWSMGDPLICVGEKAAFPGWWDDMVIKNLLTPLVMLACLSSSLLSCKDFYIINFLAVFHTLPNLLFFSICTYEKRLVMRNIYALWCVSCFYIAH